MSEFNPAYASLFPQQGLSLGLMTPVAAHGLADPARRGALRGWPMILVSPRCGRAMYR
jgi:hypothetical protein